MALVLRNVPEDIDEIGLTKITRLSYALAPSSHLADLLTALQEEMERTAVGQTLQSKTIPHSLNLLNELAIEALNFFLKITTELHDQTDEFLLANGIEVVNTD